MDWIFGLALVLIAFVAAVAGLLVVNVLQTPPKRQAGSVFADIAHPGEGGSGTVYLFDGEVLVDATPGARQILATSRGRGSNWLRLIGYLTLYIPDVESELRRLDEEGQILIEGRSALGRALLVSAELRGGLTRIVLTDPAQDGKPLMTDALAHRALIQEVEQLREILAQAPMLIWRETEAGDVVWANSSYLLKAIATLPSGKELGWPLPRLFERQASQTAPRGQRASVAVPGETANWYDLQGTQSGEERLNFALPADAAVNAEAALRDFMQTLTKTFAQLPTGLGSRLIDP